MLSSIPAIKMTIQFDIDWEKALAAVVYLASKRLPEFDKYKASKLIFLADKYHLVKFARPITGDVYFALEHGPIPSQILNRIKVFESGQDEEMDRLLDLDRRFTNPRFSSKIGSTDYSVLSQSDIMALDRTVHMFGEKTFAELRAMTHAMPAYFKAWDSRPAGTKRAEMSFEDFFEQESEAIEGAMEEVLEQYSLRKAFPPSASF